MRDVTDLLLLLLTAGWLLVGCDAEETADFTVEEEGGVTVVQNTNPPVWDTLDEAPVEFERTQTFGAEDEPEEAMLASVASVTVGEDGTVYVLDRTDHRIVAFGAGGDVQWSAGEEGQGPGDMLQPIRLLLDDSERLWLSNGNGLDVWDPDGSFVERHNVRQLDEITISPGLAGVRGDTLGLFGTNPETGDRNLLRVDANELDVIDSFAVELTEAGARFPIALASPVTPVKYANGTVHVAEREGYQINRYTSAGTHTLRLERPDIEDLFGARTEQVDQGVRIFQFSGLSVPFVLPDGHYLVPSFWSTNVSDPEAWVEQTDNGDLEPAAALDVYASDHELLGRIVWEDTRTPGVGEPMSVGPDGALYTRTNDPYPQVRRYEVTIDR